jgi:predicted nucleic acid-binding Zn finger protein
MRGPGLFENYCACPDFAVNTLGTCKHIEALLLRLRKRHGHTLESKEYAHSRASISLQYGETIDVRLRLPAVPQPDLRKLAEQYFDAAGLLRREHFRSFHQAIEAFRKADLEAVIYSDVLEYSTGKMNLRRDSIWNASFSRSFAADKIPSMEC